MSGLGVVLEEALNEIAVGRVGNGVKEGFVKAQYIVRYFAQERYMTCYH